MTTDDSQQTDCGVVPFNTTGKFDSKIEELAVGFVIPWGVTASILIFLTEYLPNTVSVFFGASLLLVLTHFWIQWLPVRTEFIENNRPDSE